MSSELPLLGSDSRKRGGLPRRFSLAPLSLLCAVRLLVAVAALALAHCGPVRRGPGVQDQPGRLRYDDGLTLQLVDVLTGVVGSAELRDPVSLAVTSAGEVVILDRGAPRLIMIDSRGRVVRETSISGLGDARPLRPRWVRAGFGFTYSVATEQGNLFTYDSELRLVNAFEPAREATGFAGADLSGLTITTLGDTYVSDRTNGVVYHFDPAGRFVGAVGGADAGVGRLTRPEGLAATGDGRVVVCDTGARRLAVFDQNDLFSAALGEGELQEPVAGAVTPDNRAIFVCDRKNPSLVRYSLEGERLSEWDGTEALPDEFGALTDVAVADSSLWVVDSGRGRILRFRLVPDIK